MLRLESEKKLKNIFSINEFYDDQWATIKEIGKYLTKSGAALVAPLVIAKTVGGDIA